MKTSEVKYVVFGMIAINVVAVIGISSVISFLPKPNVVRRQRQSFPQVVAKLQSERPEDARIHSVKLLEDMDRALNDSIDLINRLTYSVLIFLVLNAGVFIFCFSRLTTQKAI
jgi:hypothetical protein